MGTEWDFESRLARAIERLPKGAVAGRLLLYARGLSEEGRRHLLSAFGADDDLPTPAPPPPSLPHSHPPPPSARAPGDIRWRATDLAERIRDDEPGWADEADDLLAEADRLFESGRRAEAPFIYGPILLAIADGEANAILDYIEWPEADLERAKTRHLRCAYEETPPKDRPDALLDQFMKLAWVGEEEIGLREVEEAADEPLPGLDEFLPRWHELLEELEPGDLWSPEGATIDCLQEEAADRGSPIDQVLTMCRAEGREQAWIWSSVTARLETWDRDADARVVAEEGLSVVEEPRMRAVLGGQLASLAEDRDERMAGLREALRGCGSVVALLLLIEATEDDPDLRHGLLSEELGFFADQTGPPRIAALVALLAGDRAAALRVAHAEADTHWGRRGSVARVVFYGLLRAAGGAVDIHGAVEPDPDDPLEQLLPPPEWSFEEHLHDLDKSRPLSESERLATLRELRPLVEERTRRVLEQTRRPQYMTMARAAVDLEAGFAALGRSTEGRRIVSGLLAEFPRHRAYRDEVERARETATIRRGGPPV